jgi:hypothetical protein
MAKRWSPEEKEIVREIWRGTEPVKSAMHRLPGRTSKQIDDQAQRLGLDPKPKVSLGWGRIKAVLADGVARTTNELAALAFLSAQQTKDILFRAMEGNEAHIHSWPLPEAGGMRQAKYRLGAGVSAPKPEPLTKREMQARWASQISREDMNDRRRKYRQTALSVRRAKRVSKRAAPGPFGILIAQLAAHKPTSTTRGTYER